MSRHDTSLLECFGIPLAVRTVALVGGGGKTSLMYALARELAQRGTRVVTTTTTKIFPPREEDSPCLVLLEDDPELQRFPAKLIQHGHVTVARAIGQASGKLEGVSEDTLRAILESAECVLVEADGAAGRPIKAPEPWEPVIPSNTDLVIPVVGLDCLGEPASRQWVFRLERFLAITDLPGGAAIEPEAVVAMITHAQGGLKGVSDTAAVVPFLNKLDLLDEADAVDRIAYGIFQETLRIKRVVAGRLKGGIFARAFLPSCPLP